MPQIDVSDIVRDPFIAGERFTVLRRVETVSAYGQSSVAIRTYPDQIGSIVPAGDNSLVREEAYQTQAKAIQVITSFRLRGASKDQAGYRYQPDIVIWKGDAFVVRSISDFSQYGAGLVQADCISIDLVDQVPAGNTAAPVSETFAVPGFSDQIPILDGEG
jgi:hypothetical protein